MPTQTRNSQYISLSELKNKIVEAFKSLTKPEEALNKVPPMPDASVFTVARPDGAICEGNDRAISIEIDDSEGLKLTFCSLLEFELDGSFDAKDLLNEFEDSLSLSVGGDFTLKGAFTFGAEIHVKSLNDVDISFDPITAQLYVDGGLEATVQFGMIEAFGSANAILTGDFGLAYCNCTDFGDDYTQVRSVGGRFTQFTLERTNQLTLFSSNDL